MSMTDPIADMLTRIRNGIQSHHERVELPASKLKVEIARILKNEGFIRNYNLQKKDEPQGTLRIDLQRRAVRTESRQERRRRRSALPGLVKEIPCHALEEKKSPSRKASRSST